MVKLILKEYTDKIALKDLVCSNCIRPILKNSTYKKHRKNDDFVRLHTICFNELSLKAISKNVENIS